MNIEEQPCQKEIPYQVETLLLSRRCESSQGARHGRVRVMDPRALAGARAPGGCECWCCLGLTSEVLRRSHVVDDQEVTPQIQQAAKATTPRSLLPASHSF